MLTILKHGSFNQCKNSKKKSIMSSRFNLNHRCSTRTNFITGNSNSNRNSNNSGSKQKNETREKTKCSNAYKSQRNWSILLNSSTSKMSLSSQRLSSQVSLPKHFYGRTARMRKRSQSRSQCQKKLTTKLQQDSYKSQRN